MRLLLLGATIGLVAAGVGLLQQGEDTESVPENALARINDSIIYPETFSRAANRLGVSVELGTENGSAFLQQLIDDELLVQRGEELGITRIDLTVARQ